MATILYLGSEESPLIDFLRSEGNTVVVRDDPIPDVATYLPIWNYDCIISYEYRYKISRATINSVNGKCVNLHISYLPWNRGANPNYWSWFDNTPKGVTIHYVDDTFDTGDIIVQKEVALTEQMTLEESYAILEQEIQQLFVEIWPTLFEIIPKPQMGRGSVHKRNENLYLSDSWKTPCGLVRRVGAAVRAYHYGGRK